MRPIFPGFRDLIHDWASFSHWFILFVVGFLVANREKLLDYVTKIRWLSLSLATASTLGIIVAFGDMNFGVDMSDPLLVPKYMLYSGLRVLMVWSTLLSCLGLAGRFCQRSSSALTYLNEAVYPLFILHLPVVVIGGYWVVQWDLSVWSKYLLIANLTGPIILIFYHFAIRPFNLMRLLFGLRLNPGDRTLKTQSSLA